ncbi:MAG: hypothetical protein NTZ05_08790 [Chloroflexi bacterium]|nr:hypothetical protein [Chloroflexota bacterium]
MATHRTEIAERREAVQRLRAVSDRTLLQGLGDRIDLGQLSRSPLARGLVGGVANPLFRAWRSVLKRVLPW